MLKGGQRLTGSALRVPRRSLVGCVLGRRRGCHHWLGRLDRECGTEPQPIGASRRVETLRRRRRGDPGRRLERRTGGPPADPAWRDVRPGDYAGGSARGDRRAARARDARHLRRQRDGVGRGRAARQGERSHRRAHRRPARAWAPTPTSGPMVSRCAAASASRAAPCTRGTITGSPWHSRSPRSARRVPRRSTAPTPSPCPTPPSSTISIGCARQK